MFDLKVTYEDGAEDEVHAGQREMAAWEKAGYGSSLAGPDEKPMLFFRFVAYAALKRSRRLPMDGLPQAPSFDVWSDRVEEVNPVDEAEADPTTPDQPQAD